MKRDDIEKLLGAYATGTLSAEERAALYEAALADQTLYDALMREEPLRELFEDPSARARLLAVLSAPAPGATARLRAWWRRPAPWALAGTLAVAGLVAFFVVTPRPPATAPLAQIEKSVAPVAALAPAPAASDELRTSAPPPTRKRQLQRLAERAENVATLPQPKAEARAAFAKMDRAEAPAPGAVSAVARLDYKVLRQSGEEFAESAPGTVFSSGDVVRLAVVAPADGRLVVESTPGVALYSVAVTKGARVVVPAAGGIELGPGAGSKTVRLSFLASSEHEVAARMLRMRDDAKGMPIAAAPQAPITVDVVLKFR
jgi:hypothetical protein